jgi:hypothetical protein
MHLLLSVYPANGYIRISTQVKQRMKPLFTLLILLLPLPNVYGQSQPPKIKVVLLGTFHYGETSDGGKTDFPDLFSTRRQQELEQIATKLARFGVNKFFVEMQFTRQKTADSLFNLYHNGRLTDTITLRDEIVQLAFRTAKLTNCKLVASDNRQELPYDKIKAYEQQHENDSIYPYSFFTQPYPFKTKQKPLKELSLTDYYIQINNQYNREKIQFDYLHYALSYGEGTDFTGEAFTLSWYDRNLKIFTNILRNLDVSKDKEIVILFGSSHTAILRQFFSNHPFFEIIELERVLK